MTRAEIVAYNRGVSDLAGIAEAAADVLRSRITTAPTRYGFGIEALAGVVEAANELLQPLPLSNDKEASDAC